MDCEDSQNHAAGGHARCHFRGSFGNPLKALLDSQLEELQKKDTTVWERWVENENIVLRDNVRMVRISGIVLTAVN